MDNTIEVVLPGVEEKESFMNWFNKEGFDAFLKSRFNKTEISCLSTFEIGTNSKSKYASIENGYIELE